MNFLFSIVSGVFFGPIGANVTNVNVTGANVTNVNVTVTGVVIIVLATTVWFGISISVLISLYESAANRLRTIFSGALQD